MNTKWNKIIKKLNEKPEEPVAILMGSAGSAQVTRCRLVSEFENLKAKTVHNVLILWLPA